MAEFTAAPRTLRPVDLDRELRIIAFGRSIYGFRTGRECARMLYGAGHTDAEIASEECAEAIRREYKRQRVCGERRAVTTVRLRRSGEPGPFDWMATFAGHGMGDPVGTGRSELDAITDLFRQQAEIVHACV
jgi:hypothetical protein